MSHTSRSLSNEMRLFRENNAAKKIQKKFRTLKKKVNRDVKTRSFLNSSRSGPILYGKAANLFSQTRRNSGSVPYPTKSALLFANLHNKNKAFGQQITSFLKEPEVILTAEELKDNPMFVNKPFLVLSNGKIHKEMNTGFGLRSITKETPLNKLYKFQSYSEEPYTSSFYPGSTSVRLNRDGMRGENSPKNAIIRKQQDFEFLFPKTEESIRFRL